MIDTVTHLHNLEDSIYKVKLSEEANLRVMERTGNRRGLLCQASRPLRTIDGHPTLAQRREVAEETIQFYVPLAERLGMKGVA